MSIIVKVFKVDLYGSKNFGEHEHFVTLMVDHFSLKAIEPRFIKWYQENIDEDCPESIAKMTGCRKVRENATDGIIVAWGEDVGLTFVRM